MSEIGKAGRPRPDEAPTEPLVVESPPPDDGEVKEILALSLEFVPNRGLPMEFSGHFSDACWASTYASIGAELPNFIGLTIVQNPGHPRDESIVGGAFLIETKAEDGAPLLVIRGLNPRENLINQLSAKDFLGKLVEYLKPIAAKQGRKLAIVIDHAGGASTNRPVLDAALQQMRKRMAPTRLESADDAMFNGYDISESCYLIE